MSTTDSVDMSNHMKTMVAPSRRGEVNLDHQALHQADKHAARELSRQNEEVKQAAAVNAHSASARQDESIEVLSSLNQELNEAITVLNESLAKTPTKAIISKDEELNRFIVKIADKKSGEIVREIPSEALLKFARQLKELKGILFDERT
jgi:flagellar protein FlaG